MTAVEFLIEKMLDSGIGICKEWREQAKEMEKQQIIDAYCIGKYINVDDREFGEKFYNETYGSKGSDDNHAYCGMIDCKCVTSFQIEISDDEIKKAAHEHGYEHHSFFTATTSNQKKLSWIAACKWYREQLKNK